MRERKTETICPQLESRAVTDHELFALARAEEAWGKPCGKEGEREREREREREECVCV